MSLRQLRLAFDRETRKWNRFQARSRNLFARHLAYAIGPELDPLERLIDLIKRVLFLREQTEREITIVSVRTSVGLVHPEGGGFASLCARTQGVLGDAGHGIDHSIAQLQQLFLLPLGKGIKPARFVVVPENFCRRIRRARTACLWTRQSTVFRFGLARRRALNCLLRRLGSLARSRLF